MEEMIRKKDLEKWQEERNLQVFCPPLPIPAISLSELKEKCEKMRLNIADGVVQPELMVKQRKAYNKALDDLIRSVEGKSEPKENEDSKLTWEEKRERSFDRSDGWEKF